MTAKELLDEHHIDYKENSTHLKVKCLSPYHDDSSPSMSIRKEDGHFRCFGCELKGGFNTLYTLVTGNYVEKNPTESWNRSIKTIEKKTFEDPEIKIIGNLKSPLKDEAIRKKLYDIGIISDKFIIDREITYSSYTEMIAKHLIDVKDIEYTKMRDRVCFPMYKKNKIINVEGRCFDKKQIELGSPKTLYVRGGSTQYLYNWDYIDIHSDIVVVEGIKDLCRVYNRYSNVVAMHHNLITEPQAELLNSCTANIIAFIDNDEGGFGKYENGVLKREGTLQALDKQLQKEFKFCFNPKKGKDPNDCSFKEIDKLLENSVYYNESLVNEYLFNTNKISNW